MRSFNLRPSIDDYTKPKSKKKKLIKKLKRKVRRLKDEIKLLKELA